MLFNLLEGRVNWEDKMAPFLFPWSYNSELENHSAKQLPGGELLSKLRWICHKCIRTENRKDKHDVTQKIIVIFLLIPCSRKFCLLFLHYIFLQRLSLSIQSKSPQSFVDSLEVIYRSQYFARSFGFSSWDPAPFVYFPLSPKEQKFLNNGIYCFPESNC